VKGDITAHEVDAIVNAANKRLMGGGGVDGAIHEAGGPTILRELRRDYASGCSTGEAVVTAAGDLKAKFVIHAVGPVYDPGDQHWCVDALSRAYRRSLELAAERGCRSVALPSISTGIFRFPTEDASRIALGVARSFLANPSSLELVRWVLYDDRTFDVFTRAAEELFPGMVKEE
jgi:O-acetyl-ADP-ribose deacetylase